MIHNQRFSLLVNHFGFSEPLLELQSFRLFFEIALDRRPFIVYSMQVTSCYGLLVLAKNAITAGFFFIEIKDSDTVLFFLFKSRLQKRVYPVFRIIHRQDQVRIYIPLIRVAHSFKQNRNNNFFPADIHIGDDNNRARFCVFRHIYDDCERMFQNFRKSFQRFMQTMRMIFFMKLPVILSEFLRRIVIQTQMSCVHHDRKRRETNLPHYFRRCTDKHGLTLILLRRIDDARQSLRKRNLIIRALSRSGFCKRMLQPLRPGQINFVFLRNVGSLFQQTFPLLLRRHFAPLRRIVRFDFTRELPVFRSHFSPVSAPGESLQSLNRMLNLMHKNLFRMRNVRINDNHVSAFVEIPVRESGIAHLLRTDREPDVPEFRIRFKQFRRIHIFAKRAVIELKA